MLLAMTITLGAILYIIMGSISFIIFKRKGIFMDINNDNFGQYIAAAFWPIGIICFLVYFFVSSHIKRDQKILKTNILIMIALLFFLGSALTVCLSKLIF